MPGKSATTCSTSAKNNTLRDVTSSGAKLGATEQQKLWLLSSSAPSLVLDPAKAESCRPAERQRWAAWQHLASLGGISRLLRVSFEICKPQLEKEAQGLVQQLWIVHWFLCWKIPRTHCQMTLDWSASDSSHMLLYIQRQKSLSLAIPDLEKTRNLHKLL